MAGNYHFLRIITEFLTVSYALKDSAGMWDSRVSKLEYFSGGKADKNLLFKAI